MKEETRKLLEEFVAWGVEQRQRADSPTLFVGESWAPPFYRADLLKALEELRNDNPIFVEHEAAKADH